jgi:multidrug resistance efflux pump
MIAFFAIIYAVLVYLVYFQFKLLPFDLKNKIAAAVLGVLFVCGILIAVNFWHPMTTDARVFQHVVQIAARTSKPGRVSEVPIEPNTPLKQGEVLFRIDPRPFQYEVDRLAAAVTAAEQSVPQLKAVVAAAEATIERSEAQRKLAQTTLDRDLELHNKNPGAVSEQTLDNHRGQLAAAEAAKLEAAAQADSARAQLKVSDQTIAEAKAQLAAARLDLEEATVVAPADGFVTVLELRPGFVVSPGQPVMSFVCEPEGVVAATLAQEFSAYVKPGDEVELCLDVYPGKTIHGKVDNVIRATGEGQIAVSGTLPTTTTKVAAARIPLRILIDKEELEKYPVPAGASGAAAIYTDRAPSFKMVRRVMLRWYTWLNYIKLSL